MNRRFIVTSEIKLLACQENGKKGGVKSEAGKAISSKNAITHGILSNEILLLGESVGELNNLRNNLVLEFDPRGEWETFLVERIITCIWKLRRLLRIETVRQNKNWKIPYDFFSIQSSELFNRYESALERQLYKTKNELERVQDIRKGNNVPPRLSIDVDVSHQNEN
jgi:hypothetical protein